MAVNVPKSHANQTSAVRDGPFIYLFLVFFGGGGGGGGLGAGVGQVPKKILAQKKYRKKIMHTGPREKNRASLSTRRILLV